MGGPGRAMPSGHTGLIGPGGCLFFNLHQGGVSAAGQQGGAGTAHCLLSRGGRAPVGCQLHRSHRHQVRGVGGVCPCGASQPGCLLCGALHCCMCCQGPNRHAFGCWGLQLRDKCAGVFFSCVQELQVPAAQLPACPVVQGQGSQHGAASLQAGVGDAHWGASHGGGASR
jgi:hypothetical protein